MNNPFLDAMVGSVDPQETDVFGPLGYEPHARQKAFHAESRKRTSAILFGGSASGGKSVALVMEAFHNAVNYPGMRIGIIRRSYPELEESIISNVAKFKWAAPFGARYNKTDHTLTFPNGSVINMSYAKNVQEASHFLGGEYQLFCIDEAGQMPPEVIQHIEERLRSGSRSLPVIGLRCATNPGGVAHKYLKDRFIIPTQKGKAVFTDKHDRTVAFVPSKFTDNPHVDRGYKKVLDSIPDPHRRAAMRDGDWDAQVGQFFEQWNSSKIEIEPFDLPVEWQRYAGIDYGKLDPFACIWCARDNDGRLYAYSELYIKGLDAPAQARSILGMEEQNREVHVIRVADPSMWGSNGTPLSIADMYGLEGCGIQRADNERLNGWARVHWYLNDAPACIYHSSLGWETCPMLHVLSGTCPNFMEYMPALPRDPNKSDDAATRNCEDHLPDAFRYLCMEAGTSASPIFYDQSPSLQAQKEYQSLVSKAYSLPSNNEDVRSALVGGMFGGSLEREASPYDY